MAEIVRPLKFDNPRKNQRLRKRRETDAKRRERQRDTVIRRIYRMLERADLDSKIFWEDHDNDNRPPPQPQRKER